MKSEKEKMLLGDYYDAKDPQLDLERAKAKSLVHEFNQNIGTNDENGLKILKKLLNIQGDILIEAPFYCDYGYNITLGDDFYANHGCIILDVAPVRIGSNVLFGPYVQIYTASHPTDPKERLKGLEMGSSIVIGNNVWIGGGSIICPGVSIGDNVTIGAGSVVTKSIPDNVLAAGNPCRIIRSL